MLVYCQCEGDRTPTGEDAAAGVKEGTVVDTVGVAAVVVVVVAGFLFFKVRNMVALDPAFW